MICPICNGTGEQHITHGGMCDCWRCGGKGEIKSQREIYERIYKGVMEWHLQGGVDPDKASRLANIYAVKVTWGAFNDQGEISVLEKMYDRKVCR